MSAPGEGLKPLERVHWPEERVQVLNRDWGFHFYAQKQQYETAEYYFNKCLELKEDDWSAYYFRSHCNRATAQGAQALRDAALATKHCPRKNYLADLQICDCLYEVNDFENFKINLHNGKTKYGGHKIENFDARLCIVNENFRETVGDTLGPFIMKNRKLFPLVLEKLRLKNLVDPRPLWKILQSEGRCDVLSILEKEEELLSPREQARRYRAFKVFTEAYLNKNWIDVHFLRSLRKNQTLLIPHCLGSTPLLRKLTHSKYLAVTKFLKMLHGRSPLYNLQMQSYPNKEVYDNYIQDYLYRVQYQTRRNMNTILKNVRSMRKKGDIQQLCKYVEDVMGKYVTLKTYRVMPWKLEFLYEIYYTLALAFADRFKIPKNFSKIPSEELKSIMYDMPKEANDRYTAFVFGDRSTYHDTDATDKSILAYRAKLKNFEKRMQFAKYDIEKCYLYHEIARAHLNQSRFDECISLAKKASEGDINGIKLNDENYKLLLLQWQRGATAFYGVS